MVRMNLNFTKIHRCDKYIIGLAENRETGTKENETKMKEERVQTGFGTCMGENEKGSQ